MILAQLNNALQFSIYITYAFSVFCKILYVDWFDLINNHLIG